MLCLPSCMTKPSQGYSTRGWCRDVRLEKAVEFVSAQDKTGTYTSQKPLTGEQIAFAIYVM